MNNTKSTAMEIIEKRSAGGIVVKDDMVLTLFVPGHEEVVFPKGTIEEGESPSETAVREVAEETGYHTRIVAEIDTTTYEFEEGGKQYRKTVYYFLMQLIDEHETPAPQREAGEEFENLWLSIHDARIRLTHQNNKDVLESSLGQIAKARVGGKGV